MQLPTYLDELERPHHPLKRQVVRGRRLVLAARVQPHRAALAVDDGRAAGAALGAGSRLQVEPVQARGIGAEEDEIAVVGASVSPTQACAAVCAFRCTRVCDNRFGMSGPAVHTHVLKSL